MINKPSPKISISVIIFIIVLFASAKIYELGKSPTSTKECDYVLPQSLVNVPSNIEVTINDIPLFEIVNRNGFINDASCLNKTRIWAVAKIHTEEDIVKAFEYAKNNGLKLTTAGSKHSMGGQSFIQNGLVLDTTGFNQIEVFQTNDEMKVRVQAGATWKQIQQKLDPLNLSVKAMQSINIFSVGGTISVNAHGIAHQPGQVGETIRSIKLLKPDGTISTITKETDPKLFGNVVGGYGLFGIILEVDLDIVKNENYDWQMRYTKLSEFNNFYNQNIKGNKDIKLAYARFSVSPINYFDEILVHTYTVSNDQSKYPLVESGSGFISRLVFNFSKTSDFAKAVRWELEKRVEPKIHACMSRNNLLNNEAECVTVRNQEMYDDMVYLKNDLKDTDILQEYFIPADNFENFIHELKKIVKDNNVNLLNGTIRFLTPDTVSTLAYGPNGEYALVLYFNQGFEDSQSIALAKATSELIDASIRNKGRFYLPYQLYYTKDQLRSAYPQIDSFFSDKKEIDPSEILVNTWYAKYK